MDEEPKKYPTFEQAVTAGVQQGKLREALKGYGDYMLTTAEEAHALCAALRKVPFGRSIIDPWGQLLRYIQSAEGREAIDVLKRDALPIIAEKVRAALASNEQKSDVLFSLKILAMCSAPDALDLIVQAARKPFDPGGYMWLPTLGMFSVDHPQAEELFRRLSDPLPEQFIAVALLDAATGFAIKRPLAQHPFDSPAGHARLEAWLTDTDPAHFSYAHSTAATLPFIKPPARERLMALAMDHPDVGVQMESAWASAKLGSEGGVKLLARFARDVNYSRRACHYLEEVGRGDAIPAEVLDDDFQAMAEMAGWLAHPNEFGAPPDEITLYDTRQLFWPPTDDRRRVWLFKYRYAANAEREKDETGLGMVGSVTFALFGEATADLPPEDAYGLHCAWELECKGDPRAPKKRSAKAGRKILQEHQ